MTGRLRGLAAAAAVLALGIPPAAAAAANPSSEAAGPRIVFSLAPPPAPPCERPLSLKGADPADLTRFGAGPPFPAADAGLRPRPRLARAWIEWGVFVTGITVQYWLSNSFPEDADFRLTLDDQIRRIAFLDGLRFDSNQFSLNWAHMLGAGIYYQFSRTNHTSWLYAELMSLAGSTWWETIGEPKEVISINDMFLSGLGGISIGEPWYQTSQFFVNHPAFLARVLSVMNPVLLLNRWLDHRDPATRTYVQPGWHEIGLFAGARRLSAAGAAPGADFYFGIETQLLLLPEYGRAGEVRRRLKDTYVTEFSFDMATRGGHAEETRWFAKAVPWGSFVQKIDDSGRGYSLTFGLGSAFEFFKKRPIASYDAVPVPVKSDLSRLHLDEPRAFTDKLGILHVAGPVLDLTVFRRGLRLRTVVEGYGDFGLIASTAINDYSRTHPVMGLKTTVFYYGYFYGFGGSGAASFRLDYRGLEARGRAEFGAWGSADFLDRFQADVTNNSHLVDTRALFRLGLGWTIPRTPLKVFADLEHVRRWGQLEEVRATRVETKTYAGLAFTF